jgi:NADPH:quinone reductase-like Zn-dependent oxidoreductase
MALTVAGASAAGPSLVPAQRCTAALAAVGAVAPLLGETVLCLALIGSVGTFAEQLAAARA